MTVVDGTDDNLMNFEGLDGPYTSMDAEDCEQLRGDVVPIAPADEEHPEGVERRRPQARSRGY